VKFLKSKKNSKGFRKSIKKVVVTAKKDPKANLLLHATNRQENRNQMVLTKKNKKTKKVFLS
jgi:hypothetical protein